MRRSKDTVVVAQNADRDRDLVDMIREADFQILTDTLSKNNTVSPETLEYIRTLKDMSPNVGSFLSQSVQLVNRNAFVQVMMLHESLKAIGEELKDGDKKDALGRAALYRTQAEIVKVSVTAVKAFYEGAAHLINMVNAAKSENENEGVKRKPGWGKGAKDAKGTK